MQRHLVHESHEEVSQYMYVLSYDPLNKRMLDVRLLIQGELESDATLVTATAGSWDEQRGDWRLEGGRSDRSDGGEGQDWLERPDVTPELLLQQSREKVDPETMSYTELAELIEARPNRADVRLALHRHITYPFANILLLLLALGLLLLLTLLLMLLLLLLVLLLLFLPCEQLRLLVCSLCRCDLADQDCLQIDLLIAGPGFTALLG